ncbi:YihY/virulence factor BrkB family protein [Roseococcus microcysteis]|uniref:YihY/virulence factor BrkB family protein n=1 Tax=Roseococcus microcysteis TaxID=2771361 RepID=UPI00168A6D2C|nr:YihY/virulence factor BrkB family protein [Roseococcus microcysteis]
MAGWERYEDERGARRGDWLLGGAALAAILALGAKSSLTSSPRQPIAPQRMAHQPAGSGGAARNPSDIPPRGWWQILKRTAQQANEDRLMMEAAAITFYTLLALFPALAALASLYALWTDPATIQGHLSALAGFVPEGGMQIIEEQVTRVTETAGGTLGFGAVVGLLISLWSSNQAAKAMFDALNIVYEEREKRSFVKFTAVTLAFTLCLILFAILTMMGVVAVPVVLGMVGMGSTAETLLRYGRWPLLLLMVGLVLACLYRWGPSRANAKWRWVSWGSAFASVAWLAGSAAFSWYVSNFGTFNETYGSLGAVMGFMTWIWLSALVILLGGELNAEMEHQTARDTTDAPDKPMGTRHAAMADHVAAS